jgi:hypothetical protein
MNRFWERYFARANFNQGGGDGGGAGGGGGGSGGGSDGTGGAGGSAGEPWYQPHLAALDKDTTAWLDGKKFGSITDALKSGAHADKLARDRNVIARPADLAKLDQWDGWKELGWVEDAAAYGKAITPPKMPEGQQHDAEMLQAFTKAAHGKRLPPGAAQSLYNEMSDFINQRVEGFKAQGAKATADLQAALDKEWGTDKDTNTELAKRVVRTFGVKTDTLAKLEDALGGAPDLLQFMHKIGTMLGEDKLIGGQGGGSGAMSPGAAAAERRRLESDPAWMKIFNDARHPQNAEYKARRLELIALEAKGVKAA